MAHDILVPHGPPARTTGQMDCSHVLQRQRQGEAPKHCRRQVTHDGTGRSSHAGSRRRRKRTGQSRAGETDSEGTGH